MILMLMMAIVLVLVAYYGNFAGDDIAARNDEAAVIAQQLEYQHAAAARTCDGTCANGPIDVQDELSGARRGRGAFADGSLLSVATGDYVVSWYRNRSEETDPALAREFYARVTASIVTDRNTSMWAGSYSRDTGKVVTMVPMSWKDPETGNLVPTSDPAVTVNVPAIPDLAPVIVTRK